MNLDFFKTLGSQCLGIWKEIKIYQKFTVIMVLLFLLIMLGFLTFQAASTKYSALYPAERILISDAAEVKAFLDSARVPYEVKGDTLILVPHNEVHRLRMELAAVGIPKLRMGKGFELFDSDTWIKGEKELQILEMRAIQGELQNDISEYENIKNANVILNIAPPRPFGGSLYKTKASVILTLMPGARLSNSQLRSITYHVAGAVRGLSPNMVAISDTTGKLYQPFDPNGDYDILRSAEVSVEERIKSKIDGMLAMVVGPDNFYSTVQVTMNRNKMTRERRVFQGSINGVELGDPVISSITESGLQMRERERSEIGTPGSNTEAIAGAVAESTQDLLNRSEDRTQQYRQMAVPVDHMKTNTMPGKIDHISIGVLIDKTITVGSGSDLPKEQISENGRNTLLLKKEIEAQLIEIIEGYGLAAVPAVDFVEFDKTVITRQKEDQVWGDTLSIISKIGTLILVVFVILGIFWTFNRFWNKYMNQPEEVDNEEDDDVDFFEESSLMEVEAMVESIKARIQVDPMNVADAVHKWLSEDYVFEVPKNS
jgi:flagellar M-ring protein FliF